MFNDEEVVHDTIIMGAVSAVMAMVSMAGTISIGGLNMMTAL